MLLLLGGSGCGDASLSGGQGLCCVSACVCVWVCVGVWVGAGVIFRSNQVSFEGIMTAHKLFLLLKECLDVLAVGMCVQVSVCIYM